MIPRNDRVLIERIETPQGLIQLTDQDKSQVGIVRAVGPGKWVDGKRQPLEVKVGQKVLFNSRWNDVGTDYQHNSFNWDDKLHIVQQADIFAILS